MSGPWVPAGLFVSDLEILRKYRAFPPSRPRGSWGRVYSFGNARPIFYICREAIAFCDVAHMRKPCQEKAQKGSRHVTQITSNFLANVENGWLEVPFFGPEEKS